MPAASPGLGSKPFFFLELKLGEGRVELAIELSWQAGKKTKK